MSICFTIFVLVTFAGLAWQLQAYYRKIETFQAVTSPEKTILRWQLLAMIPCFVFNLTALLWSIVFGIDGSLFKIAMGLGAIGLGYLSISSIKNRVSILTANRRYMEPTTGNLAVIYGILMLVGTFVMIGLFSTIIAYLD